MTHHPMNTADTIASLSARQPEFITLLGGHVVDVDPAAHSCTFAYTVPLAYCHSGNIVQGGFVTAMLDAAMAHACFAHLGDVTQLSSYEITTRFLGVTRGDIPLRVTGWIRKATHKTAFQEAEICTLDGEVTAVAHSVAKLSRNAPAP